MPVVYKQPAIRLFVRDDSATRAQLAFTLRSNVSPAAGHAAGETLRALLPGISGCSVERQQVEYYAVEMEPATPGMQLASVAGVLVFTTTEPQQYALVIIPGIRSEYILVTGATAGVELDTSASAIADLVAELTSGRWCNPWGYVITELAAAMVQIRP